MILLTGGAGFIGSNTLRTLNELGTDNIVIVDNIQSTSKWQNLLNRKFLEYVPKAGLWDWIDKNGSLGIEAIIHLGACSDTMEFNFDYLWQNNFHYTQQLWHLCCDNNIRFIYASSAATYGSGTQGFSDNHELNSSYAPLNQYGFSKHLFDQWALKQEKTPPHWYGIKYFNVYGPNESHKNKMASVACHAIPYAMKERKIRLFKSDRMEIEDGNQKRDFIFVQDAVDITLQFLTHNPPSGLYNAGTGSAQTFNELAKTIFSALKIPVNIEYFEMPESLKKNYQYYTQAEMKKLLDTGYNFKVTKLETGIQQYVDWISNSN